MPSVTIREAPDDRRLSFLVSSGIVDIEFIALLFGTLVLTTLVLFLLNPLAKHVRLVDYPDADRKLHQGPVPLTGGITLLITLLIIFLASDTASIPLTRTDLFWPVIAITLSILVIAHAIDDAIGMRPLSRFAIDVLLAFFIWTYASVKLVSLGDLFGMGEVAMGRSAIFMTIFCFVAASNAFNMVDGVDSLCSGLGLVCFATLICLVGLNQPPMPIPLAKPLLLVMVALVPLYFANLGVLGRKMRAFLGDAGARLIGFIAAIALICAAQAEMIRPAMAFFPIAIPVCDCLVLMGQRSLQGRSPLSADRLHLHHLLLDLGLTAHQTRRIIVFSALVLSACGIAFHIAATPTWVVSAFILGSFVTFIAVRLWLLRLRQARQPAGNTQAAS